MIPFLILAFAVFLITRKVIGALAAHQEKQTTSSAPALTQDQKLLMEIRDLLRGGGKESA